MAMPGGLGRGRGEPKRPLAARPDPTLKRFGTVRPRVQIPGPRPILEFKLPKGSVLKGDTLGGSLTCP
jgi:hypothetical protein